MRAAVVLLVGLLVAVCSCFSDKEYQIVFTKWMQTYQKAYSTEEFSTRFEIFKANMDYVQKYNFKNTGTKLDLNMFADLTNEEYRATYLRANTPRNPDLITFPEDVSLPESVDWRTKKGAVSPVDEEPVRKENVKSLTGAFMVTSEVDLRAVVSQQPAAVMIDAGHLSFQFYSSGVYYEPSCSSSELSHSALVVGYGTIDEVEYWIVKNTFGTAWGVKGYIMMVRNKENACGIATQATFPIVEDVKVSNSGKSHTGVIPHHSSSSSSSSSDSGSGTKSHGIHSSSSSSDSSSDGSGSGKSHGQPHSSVSSSSSSSSSSDGGNTGKSHHGQPHSSVSSSSSSSSSSDGGNTGKSHHGQPHSSVSSSSSSSSSSDSNTGKSHHGQPHSSASSSSSSSSASDSGSGKSHSGAPSINSGSSSDANSAASANGLHGGPADSGSNSASGTVDDSGSSAASANGLHGGNGGNGGGSSSGPIRVAQKMRKAKEAQADKLFEL